MPHIPGHVLPFDEQLTEWDKKRQRFVTAVEPAQQRVTELETRLAEVPEEEPFWLKAFKKGLPLVSPGLAPLIGAPPAPLALAPLGRVQLLRAANQDLLTTIFYSELYGTVPALVVAGAVDSVDAAMEFLSIPDNLSPTDLQAVREEISQLLSARDTGVTPAPSTADMPELAPEGQLFPPLVAPTQQRDLPITIHQLSTQALLKSLTTPKVPETTMSEEEYDEWLRQMEWSEEDIDNKLLIQRDQLIAEAQNRKSMIESYKGEVAKMPEFTLVDALKMSIINPPLIALEGLGFYYEHVSMPAAGWLYSKAIPDIQKAYEDFKGQNPDASEREAWVYAWKKWEAPGPPVLDFILKYILMEGLVDPLSYVGWGIVTRGLRTMGPVGRVLAQGNMAAAHVLELPFDAVKYITKSVIPKTVSLRAAAMSRESQSIAKRYFELYTRKPLTFMQPKDMNKAATEALEHLARNPRAEDDIALAAREILAHPPISRREATGWMGRLRSAGADPITDDLLTPQVLLDLDTTFERVFSKEMGVDEAAPYLLSHFGVAEVTEDVAVLAGRFLSDRANAIFSRALDFTLEKTANASMRAFARKTFRIFEAQASSEALVAAERSGRFGALFYNIDKRYIQPWAGWIDRMVVRTAAESYLTFGMYGPMNVLEDIMRSALGGVKPGRVTVEQYDIIVAGLLGDPELRRAGFSETFGPLRETGEAARTNWMLTLSLLPVSVPTFAVTAALKRPVTPAKFARTTFKTLVEAPGAISAELRRNFVAGRYAQLLSEHGGEAYKALLEVVPKNMPGELASAPKWVKKNLARDMRAAVTTGKLTSDNTALITALKNRYTKNRILRAEVNDVIMRYPDISPTARSMILDGFDEKLLLESPESVQSYMKQVLDAEVDDFLRSPERATAQFDLLTERLTALEVTNPQEMAELIVSLHRMSSTYGMLPNQIMARATVKSRGLPINDRRLQFDAEFDRLYNFMDKAGASVDRVIEKVRQQSLTSAADMPAGMQEATTRYLDLVTAARKVTADAKAQDIAFRSSFFADATQKDLRDPSFWNSFYATETAHWQTASKQLAAINSNLHNAIADINIASGLRIPPRAAVKVVGRPLSPADVAKLMQTRGDDLSKMLLDTLIPEGDKDYFVEYIMGLVKRNYDEGFDRASVEAVYDQIAASIQIDPASSSWFRVRQKQIESMTTDFHDLYNAKLFPVEQKRAVDSFIDETVSGADNVLFREVPTARPAEAITETARGHQESLRSLLEKEGQARGVDTGVYRTLNDSVKVVSRAARPKLTTAQRTAIASDLQDATGRLRGLAAEAFERGDTEAAALLEDATSFVARTGTAIEPPLRTMRPEFLDYDKARQSALDEAQKWYYKEYTDYTNINALDAIMTRVYPFWKYESQRWFWLARSFVRRPGTLTTWGRWEDNTEFGYVHVQGTSIDVNPARGTVYGPWSTRLMRRDYPEYYDELEGFGGLVGFFDFVSRYGFYVNIIGGALQAQFGGSSGQLGGILPSAASTPLNALIAAFPDNPLVTFISDKVFPEQFRNYLRAKSVDDQGGDGSLVYAKIQAGQELTAEEEAMWTESRRRVALHSAAFEQLGFARMKSDKAYELQQASTAWIEEQYGYTAEQQRTLRRRGEKIWDLIGGLDPWETAVLQEMEFFKYSGSINPVLPSHKQAILGEIELDWAEVMNYTEAQRDEILELQQDFLTGTARGTLGPIEFLDRVKDLMSKRRDFIDEKVKANPLMLLENRRDFYEKYGDPMPVQSPYNELMDMYFSIELKDTVDPATGERILDWDKFFANREMITTAIPADDKGRWDTFLQRNTAPMMQVYKEVSATYFRKYNGLWDKTLEAYSEEEQQLINEYLYLERTGKQLDRRATIKETVSERDGNKLISSFRSSVAEERRALRYANPHLDAWLFYWGKTTTFVSLTGEETYRHLAERTGRVID